MGFHNKNQETQMAGAADLAKLVPGFEFLQGLMKNAGAALPGVPGMGQWIVPTLDPDELDKRIQELKTVQFWLEQNARLLSTTIQALEVQRMTLSTLRTMNLPLTELRDALKVAPRPPAAPAAAPKAAQAKADDEQAPDDRDGGGNAAGASAAASPSAAAAADGAAAPAAGAGAAPPIDPLQWWSALTQQFTQIATQAVKDTAAQAAAAHAAAVGDAGAQPVTGATGKPQPSPSPAGAAKAAPRRPARKTAG